MHASLMLAKGYEFRQNSKTKFLKEKKKQPKPNKSEKKLTIYSLINTSIFRAFHSISLFIHTKKRKQIFGETSWKTTPTPICHCIRRTLVCALNYSSKHCLVLVLILNSLKKKRDPVSGFEILISLNWSPTDCHWDNWWKTYI